MHVPRATVANQMGVGSIHGRRDVATHQRRSFVNRTRGCRDISSPKVPWRIGCHGVSCRAVSGRSYLDFPLNDIRTCIARCAGSLVYYDRDAMVSEYIISNLSRAPCAKKMHPAHPNQCCQTDEWPFRRLRRQKPLESSKLN